MKKSIIIAILLVLCLATAAFAEGTLEITDVVVEVDGDKDKNVDELGGTIEVSPGSTIEIEIKLANTFDRDDDIEIQDIAIFATLFDIDDGSDLEVDLDDFDIDADDDERVTITFEVPLRVDDDIFDLEIEIEAEADDENGTDYDMLLEYSVEVEKERDELVFSRLDLAPTSVTCDDLVQLDFTIINIGRDAQDKTSIYVSSAALGYDFNDEHDFENDPDDDDIEYSKRLDIPVEDVNPGIYQILVKAKYGSDTLEEMLTMTVGKCANNQPTQPTTPPVTPTQPTTPEPTTPDVTPTEPVEDKEVVFQYSNPEPSQRYVMSDTSKDKDSSDMKWIIIIVITDIVLIVAGILIYLAFRKKR